MHTTRKAKTRYLDNVIDGLVSMFLLLSVGSVVLMVGYIAVGLSRSHLMRDEKIVRDTTEMDAQGRITKTTRVVENAPTTSVKDLLTLLSSVLLFAGFSATVYQLRQSQKQQRDIEDWKRKDFESARLQQFQVENWKRAEFVGNELRVFSKDQAVVNMKRLLEAMDAEYDALVMLDMAMKEGQEQKRIEVRVDKQTMANGFTPDPGPFVDVNTGAVLADKLQQTPLENKIAYELDGFCVYLIGFGKLIRDGILSKKDLDPYLKYWLGIMLDPPEEASGIAATRTRAKHVRRALHSYLRNYYPTESIFIADVLDKNIKDTPLSPDADEAGNA
jgi:hypothetical protein